MTLSAAGCWIVAFLVGGIPFGYFVGRHVLKDDIRNHGSGNIGATNVARVIGWKWGAVVLVLDALKGLLPTLGTREVLEALNPGVVHNNAVVMAGVCAIIGHMYPVWLKLRGGKGVATALGVICIIAPTATTVAFVTFLAVALATRLVALASMSAAVSFLVIQFWRLRHRLADPAMTGLSLFSLAVPLLIIWRHRSNIVRIWHGTEPQFGSSVQRSTPDGEVN